MPDPFEKPPRLPPRWFIRMAWKVHRGIYLVGYFTDGPNLVTMAMNG